MACLYALLTPGRVAVMKGSELHKDHLPMVIANFSCVEKAGLLHTIAKND